MLQKIVDDDWDRRHDDADGPANAPSHMRASLMSSQVLIPLREWRARPSGRTRGIFFCEFDGPRERKIFVTTLQQ